MMPKIEKFSSKEYEFRYLEESDYDKGMFETLSQLTKAPKPSLSDFKDFWSKMQNCENQIINIVGVDRSTGTIVAFGTIMIVDSILKGKVGKIENIVTCKTVRGKGLGKIIILALQDEGWRNQCNTMTLYCEEKNVEFYKKLGFSVEGNILAAYKIQKKREL